VAGLNRDTSNTNGTIAKLPDVNNLLHNQADMMGSASAAGSAVATQIGAIANAKHDAAQKAADQAKASGDTELAAQYQAEADKWDEGGTYRVALHTAGGALIAGLGGGSAAGGAIGAGLSAAIGGKLNQLADTFSSGNGEGADPGLTAGNVAANMIAGGVGGLVGGNSGAVTAANADLYNRDGTNGQGKGGTGSQFIDSAIANAVSGVLDLKNAWTNAVTSVVDQVGRMA
jgi:filamentous hemagglutinin